MSKGIGIIAWLRHFVPLTTLLNICRSLIDPHILMVSLLGANPQKYISTKSLLCKSVLYVFFFITIANLTLFLFPLLRESCRWKWSTLNRLLLCYMTSVITLLLLIFLTLTLTFSLVPNKFIPPTSQGLQQQAGNFYIKKLRKNKQLLSFSRIGVKIWKYNPLRTSWTKKIIL